MTSKLTARAILLSHLSFLMQLFRADGLTQPGRINFIGAPTNIWHYFEHALNPVHLQALVFFLGLLAGSGLFLAHALSRLHVRALMAFLLISEGLLLSLDLRLCGRFALLLLVATAGYIVAEETGARSWTAVFPANPIQGLLLWPFLALALLQSKHHDRWWTLLLIATVGCGLRQGDIDLLLLAFSLVLSQSESPPTLACPRLQVVCLAVFVAVAPLFWTPETTKVRIHLKRNESAHNLTVEFGQSGTSVALDGEPLKPPWREEKTILCNPLYFTRCEPYALGFDRIFRCYCEEVTRRAHLNSAEFQRLPNP